MFTVYSNTVIICLLTVCVIV